MKPRVEIITMMYNEADFAPFFLKHYDWVDKINVFLDNDSTDNTEEIVKSFSNTNVINFKFPDGMDDLIKVNLINNLYQEIKSDWVIVVDADEFIFNDELMSNIKNYLKEHKNEQVIHVKLWNVYKHKTEGKLDINKIVSEQRRYGIPNMLGQNACYTKPSIVKGNVPNLYWGLGHHYVYINDLEINQQKILTGAHWAMADVDIAIKRRIEGRKLRQSKRNIENGWTVQHHNITEEEIRQECQNMNSCLRCF